MKRPEPVSKIQLDIKMDAITGYLLESKKPKTVNVTGIYRLYSEKLSNTSAFYGDSYSLGYGYDHKIAKNFTSGKLHCHSKNYTVCVNFTEEPICFFNVTSEVESVLEVSAINSTSNVSDCNPLNYENMHYSILNRNGSIYTLGGFASNSFFNGTSVIIGNTPLNFTSPSRYLHDILQVNGTDVLIGGQMQFLSPTGDVALWDYKYFTQTENFASNISVLQNNSWKSIYSFDGYYSYLVTNDILYIANTLDGLYNVSIVQKNDDFELNLNPKLSNVPYGIIYGIAQSTANEDFLIVFMSDIWYYSKRSKIWFRTNIKSPTSYYTQYFAYKNYTIGQIKSPYRFGTSINPNNNVSAYFILDEDCLAMETVDIIPKRGSRLFSYNNTLYEGPGRRLFNYFNSSNEISFSKSPNNNCTTFDYCNLQYECISCVDTPGCTWLQDQCTSGPMNSFNLQTRDAAPTCPKHKSIRTNTRYELTLPSDGLWVRVDMLNDTCSDIYIQSRYSKPVELYLQSIPYFLRKDRVPIILEPEISITLRDLRWYIGPLFFKLSHNQSEPILGDFRIQLVSNPSYCKDGGTIELVLLGILSTLLIVLLGSMIFIGIRYTQLRNRNHEEVNDEPPPPNVTQYSISLANNRVRLITTLDDYSNVDTATEEARLLPLSCTAYGGAHSLNFIIRKPTLSSKLHDKFSFGRSLWIDKRFKKYKDLIN